MIRTFYTNRIEEEEEEERSSAYEDKIGRSMAKKAYRCNRETCLNARTYKQNHVYYKCACCNFPNELFIICSANRLQFHNISSSRMHLLLFGNCTIRTKRFRKYSIFDWATCSTAIWWNKHLLNHWCAIKRAKLDWPIGATRCRSTTSSTSTY